MEKYVNKKGQSTVEAAIIVPMILTFMLLIIYCWLKFFQYTYGVLDVHEAVLKNKASQPVVIELADFDKQWTYNYEGQTMKAKTLQHILEQVIYYYEHYKDRLQVPVENRRDNH